MLLVNFFSIILTILSVSDAWRLPQSKFLSFKPRNGKLFMKNSLVETLLVPTSFDETSISAFKNLRSNLNIVKTDKVDSLRWLLSNDGLILDIYDHKNNQYVDKFNDQIEKRKNINSPDFNFNSKLSLELTKAIEIVQRASFLSRSYQKKTIDLKSVSLTKGDTSPVTIGDFAVQAIILNHLKKAFPNDKFIAEEESKTLLDSPELAQGILNLVNTALGENWTLENLFEAIDIGKHNKTDQGRVWVLDPIDGTKGFVRGSHYCIALALLEDGIPQISVLGSPNLDLNSVLDQNPLKVHPWVAIETNNQISMIPNENLGSIYFAARDLGSHARVLTHPLESNKKVHVNNVNKLEGETMCESYESTSVNKPVKDKFVSSLKLNPVFLPIDAQVKYCVVGAGGSIATLRLTPNNFDDNLWDFLPGTFFVEQAGGKITDLHGRPITFKWGRKLHTQVRGILASNGLVHDKLLNGIYEARYGNN